MTPSKNWPLIIVAAITALGFGLRLINLGQSDLIFDEAASVFIARKPLAEMIPYLLRAFHEHPPGYYTLLAGWIQLVGDSESMLRMLSVFFGTLSIPLIYRWAREAIGVKAGLVAALLLSLAPVHVFYSQNARMYTLIGALAVVSWLLIVRLQKADRVKYWIALSACGLFGLATHYYMGFVIASQAFYLLVTWQQNKRLFLKWLVWLGTPLAFAGLYVLLSPGVMGTLRAMFKGGLGSVVTIGSLRALAADLVFGPHGNLGIGAWSIVLGVMAFGIGLALSNRVGVKRSIGLQLLSAIIVPVIFVVLMPETLAVRYVLFLAFPMILALSLVILLPVIISTRRTMWVPSMAILTAMIALNVSRLPYHYAAVTSVYGRTIAFLRANDRSGDGVIFNGPWQSILQQYYPIGQVPYVYLPPQSPPFLDPQATEPHLIEFLKTYQRLWVIPLEVDLSDPDRYVVGWLNAHAYHAIEEKNIALYYAPPQSIDAILSQPIRFDQAVQLTTAQIASTTLQAGDAALVTLTWQTTQSINGDLQITLEVIDQSGEVWGQRIYRPGAYYMTPEQWNSGQSIVDRQAIPIDPGAPPGNYFLRVAVQRMSSGEVLPAMDQPDPTYAALTALKINAPHERVADEQLPGTHVNVRFADRLELIVYRLSATQFVQGGVVPITLYWRSLGGERDVDVDVTLVDSSGKVLDQSRGPLGPEWYRATRWPKDSVVATSTALYIPPRLNGGAYQLHVTMRDPAGQPIAAQGQVAHPGFLALWTEQTAETHDTWKIGDVSIAERERNFQVPAFQHALSIKFGDQIQLLGFDLDATHAQPGGQLRVKFYWQALKDIDHNFVVFTHLIDANGQQQGQHDSMPVGGLNPTTFWQQDEVIADEYVIDIDPNARSGSYTLDFGWYESDSGTRLSAIAVNGGRYRDDVAKITGISTEP